MLSISTSKIVDKNKTKTQEDAGEYIKGNSVHVTSLFIKSKESCCETKWLYSYVWMLPPKKVGQRTTNKDQ